MFMLAVNMFDIQVVGTVLGGETFNVTSNYVLQSTSGIQGSYIDLPVGRDAVTKLEFQLVGSYYAALSEIEIFVEQSPEEWR